MYLFIKAFASAVLYAQKLREVAGETVQKEKLIFSPLVEQAMERMLEQEQFAIGWEE